MKKLRSTLPLVLLVMGASLVGLEGCQLFSNKAATEGDIDHTPRDRRIGSIQSLGDVKTNSQGTNLLIMDDGSTVLLKSLAINLDDSKYSGKKVEVSGLLTYTTDGKQIMEVESIDILDDAPVVTQQAAVSWRDYVNAGLGFRVKYRDDFLVDDGGLTISFARAVKPEILMMMTQEKSSTMEQVNEHTIAISAKMKTAGQSLVKDVLKLSDDKAPTLLAAGISKSRIGLDGIDAYKQTGSSGKTVNFWFEADGKIYQITYTGGPDAQSLEDQNVFYDFLATFQLLNGAPSSPSTQEDTDDSINNTPAPSPSGSVGSAIKNSAADFDDTDSGSDSPSTPVSSSTSGTSTTPVPGTAPTPAPAISTTQESLPGYSSFTSSGYKFTMQYPKSWYFGQSSSSESGVIRRYDFGSKPVDEEPGSVTLDLMSGSLPSGTSMSVGGRTVIKTSSGDTVSYYYKGENGRIYRVSGPATQSSSLQNMISTVEEQ